MGVVVIGIELVKEMKVKGYNVGCTTPTVKCTLFQDNSGALTLAKSPAMRPRTKHINVKYHHFRMAVANEEIKLKVVKSEKQPADLLTKQSEYKLFVAHRESIMGR